MTSTPGAPPPHDPGPGPEARYPTHTGVRARAAEPEPDAGSSPAAPRRSVGGHLAALVRELLIVGVIALVLSFLVKTFLVQAFYIPSESMESTLVKDDRVIVSKLTPSLIDLKRGDVVVFADPDHWLTPELRADRGPVLNRIQDLLTFVGLLPDTAEGHLIKRVIGLPRDKVACCDTGGRLTVNGVAITEPYVKPGEEPSEITFDITVPSGRVWVMGDNRGHSSDSRLHDGDGKGNEGSVPIDLIVGRAVLTIWPLDRITWLSNDADTFAKVPGT